MKRIAFIILILPCVAFSATETYVCSYPTYSNEDGKHKLSEKFELTFMVDRSSGKSYMIGNNGSTEVTLLEISGQLSFLEVTGTLNLVTTAIDSSLNSVHSRNTVLSGELIPSQYYGKCSNK